MAVNNTSKVRACELKFGKRWNLNTRYVTQFTFGERGHIDAAVEVKGQAAIDLLTPGVAWYEGRGDSLTVEHIQASIQFAKDHPDAVVPNPFYTSKLKAFNPLGYQKCVDA